jgi:D-3-phosphoglycerate dehydrogenase
VAKVLVSDTLAQQGLDILEAAKGIEVDYKPGIAPGDLIAAIGDADALVIRSGTKVTADVIEAGTKLRAIGRAGIGVDNVDVPAATARGIVVMNTPEGNNVTTAES